MFISLNNVYEKVICFEPDFCRSAQLGNVTFV